MTKRGGNPGKRSQDGADAADCVELRSYTGIKGDKKKCPFRGSLTGFFRELDEVGQAEKKEKCA
jgi:hypothetical protein